MGHLIKWIKSGVNSGVKPSVKNGVNSAVPTVRESQQILRSQGKSGKVRENREGQGKVREF